MSSFWEDTSMPTVDDMFAMAVVVLLGLGFVAGVLAMACARCCCTAIPRFLAARRRRRDELHRQFLVKKM